MGYEFYDFEEALNAALGEPENDSERRGDSRLRTVYRVARAHALGDQGLVRVINISDHGLMLSTKLDVMLGVDVTVDLSETSALTGSVVWLRADLCGLKLETPIDCQALLMRLRHEQRAPRARELRLTLDKQVLCASDLGVQIVQLRDISQKGAKIAHDGRLFRDLAIRLQITPLVECKGLVRWSQGDLAGVEFEEVLSVPHLGSIRRL